MKESQPQERRRHPRQPLVIRVAHYHANAYLYYYSQDLSLGGMFLQTREPFAVGTRLALDFELPGRERRVEVEGEVARTVTAGLDDHVAVPGMGIAFTAIDPASRAELAAFLESV